MGNRLSAFGRSLYGRLGAVLLGLLLLLGLLYSLLTVYTTQRYQQEVSQRLNRELAAHLASELPLLRNRQVNAAAMKELLHMLMVINPSIEVYVLDVTGRILSYSAPPDKMKRMTVSLDPVLRFLADRDNALVLGDDPRDLQRQKVFSVAPIRMHGAVQGYVYIILASEEYDSVAALLRASLGLRLGIGAAAGGAIVALGLGLLLFYALTRRLRRLGDSMESFRRSGFAEPPALAPRRRDEIGQLEASFQELSQRIIAQMALLKQTDTLRRELVANVSHDLRTPLASLRGYLDTLLLKEGQLAAGVQREYLQTAARHAARLAQLIGELFELAKLDSGAIRPQREVFSAGELMQDIAQKFHLAAEQRGVHLETQASDTLPFVEADIGLIERALGNLLDNALRHTPTGGRVAILLRDAPGRVVVRVSDTGVGIPPEDLPHIFERFYRARNGQRDGAGLGLAIALRILELHNSPLEVDSQPGRGTSFTFYLPVRQQAA